VATIHESFLRGIEIEGGGKRRRSRFFARPVVEILEIRNLEFWG
jgi:hypothetical protein